FIFLWSTGFIGAKYGLPYAEPLSFLLIRYGLVIALMTVIALATRAPWPKDPKQLVHIGVSGVLVHAVYLGGVFVAIKHGLPAGVTALVVGMQPLLTALGAGWLLGEQVSGRQWSGLALGFVGVGLVVSGKFGEAALGPMLVPALVALLGITAGTLYQKRFCAQFDLRTGSVIQFVPTAIVTAMAVALFEEFRIEWTPDFIFALGWLVLVLSLGAISLLNLLIRSGSAVNVASLFYLTPISTAVIAWVIFGEKLTSTAAVGMLLAVSGVYLVARAK
ncbi:MAG: DMT family transporter, partial [Azonexus sp.]